MGNDVILILGIGLIILAVVGRVKTPHFEVGVRSTWKRFILGTVGLALIATFFSGELKMLYRKLCPPALTPVIVIDPIDSGSLNQDVKYLGDKVHRNLAELLNNAGHRIIAPPLSVAEPSTCSVEKKFSIKLTSDGVNLAIHVTLASADGSIIASTELTALLPELMGIYKALPEAILFGLDVDKQTLRMKNTAKRPTNSAEAFAFYLYARRMLGSGDVESAQTALKKAISFDSQFALAYWSLGVLMSEQGNTSEGQEFIKKASLLDPDHPKIPLRSSSQRSNPVPDLMSAVRVTRGQVQELEPGFSFAKVASKDYGIDLYIWTVDPARFDIGIIEQEDPHGSNVAEFLEDDKAILAINGGFFNIDNLQRLNAAGVLVVNGVIRNPSQNNQSGALVRDSSGIKIIWAKDLRALTSYNFVVQAGPILVEGPGQIGIKRNDYDRLNRAAVCTRGAEIIFVVLHGSRGIGLSLYEFSELLAAREMDGGLGCNLSLNLDGGPSTQFAMNHFGVKEKVDGLWKIHNAIIVRKK